MVWLLVITLVDAAILIGAWWLALLPEQETASILHIRAIATALLLSTPARDEIPRITQLTFGYALLRYALYGLVACARAILPAIAAGAVASDRKSGRMEELKMIPVSPVVAYLARTLTPTLPFLILMALTPVVFATVLIAEHVPMLEIVRLMQESYGQVMLAALISVTCSVLFASAWSARCAAYFGLWLLLPSFWAAILWKAGVTGFALRPDEVDGRSPDFMLICAAQLALTGAACLAAFLLGVRGYRKIGGS
jgi:hypothetical protein